jgi:hypothetical protein
MAIVCLAQISVRSESKPASESAAVRTEMHNVTYHFTDEITVHIRDLLGQLIPDNPEGPVIFDDKDSFTLRIDGAEIAMGTDALSRVLNQRVFGASDAPLKQLAITAHGNVLTVKGKLHSKGDLAFESEGSLSATDDGEIRIHTQKIKAAHLPVKAMMDLLGVKIANLISTEKVRGVRVDGDDLLIDVQQILPPPRIEGRVTSVRIEGPQLVQVFGTLPKDGERARKIVGTHGNYMAYRGARLQFGKLTMSDADMILIDTDPKDPFDFFLDRYKDQLVAGYSKTTPENGLRVYMPDFNKLRPAHKLGTKEP